MELTYSEEKMHNVLRMAANVVDSVDIAKRLSGALSELVNLEDDLAEHPQTKALFEEIFSLIDYAEKRHVTNSVKRMSLSVRMYLFKLIFRLDFTVDSIYYASITTPRGDNPEVEEWRKNIKLTRNDFLKRR